MLTQHQRLAIKRHLAAGFESFRRPRPLRLSEWAAQHFYLSEESSYVQGKWEAFPYQVGIMDAISNDDIRLIAWPKAARVGNTKIMLAAIGYFAHHKKRNQAIWQPVAADAIEFVKTELDPMLRDVEAVRDVFPWFGKKHKCNTLEQKTFLGSILHIRAGKAAGNYRRISIDVAMLDEIDAFDDDIEGEGPPQDLAAKRIEGATFPKLIVGSTPKNRINSKICIIADEADCTLRFCIPCPACDHFHPLTWGGMKFDSLDSNDIKHECPACNYQYAQSDYLTVWQRGRWQSDEVYFDADAQFRSIETGAIVEPYASVAFAGLWTAYSPMTTWLNIKREFAKARGRPEKMKAFTNLTLGEPWEDEAESVDENTVINRREAYGADCPGGVLCLTAGVDVQGDRIEMIVIGWGQGEESWFVDCNVLYGHTDQADVWQQLDQALSASYQHASGAHLPISSALIDSGYRTDFVYDFCYGKHLRRIFAAKGVEGATRPLVGATSAVGLRGNKNSKVKLWSIGVDGAKELIYSRLNITEHGPGYIHVPAGHALLSEEFAAQLTAEKRITKKVRGFPVQQWIKTRARNEALDCTVYALAALRLLNPNWRTLDSNLQNAAPVGAVAAESRPHYSRVRSQYLGRR